MKPIALVDLDDTLFQTRRKCPDDVELTPLAHGKDGDALGFATPRQLSFVRWLSETTHLIPVTGRSLDALRRVKLEYAAAVCAHGGIVLDDEGCVDAEWSAYVTRESQRYRATLDTLSQHAHSANEMAGAGLAVRILSEGEVPLYLLIKHPDGDETHIAGVVEKVAPAMPADWTLHRNGNNVAFMPPFLGKEHAVASFLPRLRERFPNAPVLGIGDSLTDAPYMGLCDFAMTPVGSQLARAFRS